MKRLALCLTLVLFAAGCALKHPNSTPVTDYEKVTLANGTLAQTNNSVARGVIQLQGILSQGSIEKIERISGAIAADDNKLTVILDQGPTAASGQAAQIQALLATIINELDVGIHDGTFAVKNPATQQAFSADLQAMRDLAVQLTNTLKSAGVLK